MYTSITSLRSLASCNDIFYQTSPNSNANIVESKVHDAGLHWTYGDLEWDLTVEYELPSVLCRPNHNDYELVAFGCIVCDTSSLYLVYSNLFFCS